MSISDFIRNGRPRSSHQGRGRLTRGTPFGFVGIVAAAATVALIVISFTAVNWFDIKGSDLGYGTTLQATFNYSDLASDRLHQRLRDRALLVGWAGYSSSSQPVSQPSLHPAMPRIRIAGLGLRASTNVSSAKSHNHGRSATKKDTSFSFFVVDEWSSGPWLTMGGLLVPLIGGARAASAPGSARSR
jgi:hypothetical protein